MSFISSEKYCTFLVSSSQWTTNVRTLFGLANVLSFYLCDSGLFEWSEICGGFLLAFHLYMYCWRSSYKEGRVWIPLTNQTRPSQDLDFNRHMPLIFFLHFQWVEVRLVFRFFDIGGTVDHHCLNYLFLILHVYICIK